MVRDRVRIFIVENSHNNWLIRTTFFAPSVPFYQFEYQSNLHHRFIIAIFQLYRYWEDKTEGEIIQEWKLILFAFGSIFHIVWKFYCFTMKRWISNCLGKFRAVLTMSLLHIQKIFFFWILIVTVHYDSATLHGWHLNLIDSHDLLRIVRVS